METIKNVWFENVRKTIAANAGNFYLTSAVFARKDEKRGARAAGRGDNSAEKGGLGGTDVPPGCNDTTALTC